MYTIGVDKNSREWSMLVSALGGRIAELRDVCCSVESTDDERRDGAIRIDELTNLLHAPHRNQIMAEQAQLLRVPGTY